MRVSTTSVKSQCQSIKSLSVISHHIRNRDSSVVEENPAAGLHGDGDNPPCLLGDDGRGLVPGGIRGPGVGDGAASPGQSHGGGAETPGSRVSSQLESGGAAQGTMGRWESNL